MDPEIAERLNESFRCTLKWSKKLRKLHTKQCYSFYVSNTSNRLILVFCIDRSKMVCERYYTKLNALDITTLNEIPSTVSASHLSLEINKNNKVRIPDLEEEYQEWTLTKKNNLKRGHLQLVNITGCVNNTMDLHSVYIVCINTRDPLKPSLERISVKCTPEMHAWAKAMGGPLTTALTG